MFKKTLAATGAALMLATLGASSAAALQQPDDTGDVNRQALVEQWYDDFLGRDVDPGAQYWVDLLETEPPIDVLNGIQNSPEFASVTVDTIYNYFLGRGANDDRGAQVWRDGVRGDMAPEWVSQNVLASPEFATKNGSATVDQWYTLVLNRPAAVAANAGEEAYWNGRIKEVGSLAALREVWYSPEAVEMRIANTYLASLGREPSEGEINYWYDSMIRSLKDTTNAFATSPEYQEVAASDTRENRD